MRYALAIVLPEPLQSDLRSLQERYELPSWKPAIPLHITLVAPFDSDMDIQELIGRLEPVTHGALFTVTLDGIGRFDNEKSVLFAHVIPSPELSSLAADAYRALAHQPARAYVPHATLADSTTKETVDEYMLRLSGERISYSFICDRFALLQKNDSAHRWDVIRDFPFVDESSERR